MSASLLAAGCNAQNAEETGGAVGVVLGVVLGAVLGGNGDMGAAGGALFGGAAGFIAGSLVGTVFDETILARQRDATQAALDGDTTIRWVNRKDEGVHGYTEIVGTGTVSRGPLQRGTGEAAPARAKREPSARRAKTQAAAPPGAPSDREQPPAAAASAAAETVCRVAREVIWAEGRERTSQVEYCRAAGASAWVKKAA